MHKLIDVKSDRREVFLLAILTSYAEEYNDHKTRYYSIHEGTFYAYCEKPPYAPKGDVKELPFAMSKEGMIDFIWLWLQEAEYPKEKYSGDGSNKKGFHVLKTWQQGFDCICSVAPYWIYYGK